MARNLRNHIVIHNNVDTEGAGCSGSGPSYSVEYDSTVDLSNTKVGYYVYIEKRAAGAGGSSTVLSTYVYVITAVEGLGEAEAPVLTMKYLYDTAGTGDDSPCDLPAGTGSSGSPEQATHDIVMILGSAFEMFVD